MGGGRDDITMIEWLGEELGGDEATGVGDIGHEEGTDGVSDLSELGVVVICWVGTGSADDHLRLELSGLLGQCFVIDQTILFLDVVWLTLEIDGG